MLAREPPKKRLPGRIARPTTSAFPCRLWPSNGLSIFERSKALTAPRQLTISGHSLDDSSPPNCVRNPSPANRRNISMKLVLLVH